MWEDEQQSSGSLRLEAVVTVWCEIFIAVLLDEKFQGDLVASKVIPIEIILISTHCMHDHIKKLDKLQEPRAQL